MFWFGTDFLENNKLYHFWREGNVSGVHGLVKLSLITKRQDMINFVEAMCPENVHLAIASDFNAISFSNTKLLLIDASIFNDFNLETLEYGENCSEFSICILPQDIPSQVTTYVEKSFKYILPRKLPR